MTETNRMLALTICAYRKPGMDEDEYHEYLSKKHAPLFKDLLLKNKILGYTMVSHLVNQTIMACIFRVTTTENWLAT